MTPEPLPSFPPDLPIPDDDGLDVASALQIGDSDDARFKPMSKRMGSAVLLSLLAHGLLLSITFGGQTLGLPSLALPWHERRLKADELTVTLAPMPAMQMEHPSTPALPDSQAVAASVPTQASPSVSTPGAFQTTVIATDAQPPSASAVPQGMPASASDRTGAASAGQDGQERQPRARPGDDAPQSAVASAVAAQDAKDAARRKEQASVDEQARLAIIQLEAAQAEAARNEAMRKETLRLEREQQAQRDEARREILRNEQAIEQARVQAAKADALRQEQARLEEEAQRAAAKLGQQQAELAKAEAARQEQTRRQEELQRAAAAKLVQQQAELAKAEALRQEQARQQEDAQRVAAAKLAQRQAELAKADALRQEQARQQEEAQRIAVAKLAQQQAELAKAEALRQEQARQQEEAQRSAARLAQERAEAAKAEALRQEQRKQEQSKQAQLDAARQAQNQQDLARQETARQEQIKKDQAQRDRAQQEAEREERLKAIGRQLNQEAVQRDAAATPPAPGLMPSESNLRRGWMFGRIDANGDLVLYADAMAKKIEMNVPVDTVRDLLKQAHVQPTVTVAVRADGSVEKVTMTVSSGVPALDEAIRKIVASQAPYGAFPPALARRYDVMEIRRLWTFDNAIRLQ